MFPYGGILISPSSISTHAVPGFLLARAADSSEKTEDSGGNGEWLGGFGNKNELFLPGERAVQSNKPKGMAKQKRQVGQSNALSEKPVDETPPIWKAFFKATKEKLFTGTLKNISVWTGLAIIVSVIATYAAYRSLNQFRDTSFRQMEEQLNATRARHDELAQQNPQERLIEATENAKQQTITLQRIRASQQQGVSDLLAEGIARDSNTALANLVGTLSTILSVKPA
ncbi:hypothetical protein BESB_085640 [Besnoitia besnoiti]|uniref:Transmembrane protein n=1 Tax=Besnoitia besnoiti TaxID=94643 RepID=A0A2A9M5Y0_BESBE|nr:hypothetical protein BESB_085640 [Besnoitia besnoiti]PFH33365.1 hypothetical protein BESB_085640 [Besnoitia besnoiti]